jgi:hypothetical protein
MTREEPAALVAALADMAENYGNACDIAAPADRFYPFINKVVGRLAHSWLRRAVDAKITAGTKGKSRAITAGAPAPSFSGDLLQLDTFVAERERLADFLSAAFVAEAALVKALASGDTGLEDPDIAARYRRAQKRGRSRREIDSCLTQIRFLAAMATASPRADGVRRGAALDRLVRDLTEG